MALDGTKIAANATADRNLTREQLEEFARRVFDEAEAIDAQEDELYGDNRGDEIPEDLADEGARIEWLRNKIAERQLNADAKATNGTQRKPRVNMTDPDSALQRAPQGYLQGYNGQLALTPEQVIVAADLTADNNDNLQFEAMVTQAKDNLASAGADKIGTVVADAGYFDETNTFLDLGPPCPQGIDATISLSFSAGVDHSRVFRGRPLRPSAAALSSASETFERSRSLGKY